MSNKLNVSVSLKSGSNRIAYAAVVYDDGENKQTIIYKSSQNHLNDVFLDVLNHAVLKDIETISTNYSEINVNLNKNKFSKLLSEGKGLVNERDIETIRKSEALYDRLLSIKSKTNIVFDFDHMKIASIYNEELSYDNMSKFSELKNNKVVYGGLVIVSGEDLKLKNNIKIENEVENKAPLNNKENNKLNLFIDVVQLEKDETINYIGIALVKNVEGKNVTIFSNIVPVKANDKTEALSYQMDKLLLKAKLEEKDHISNLRRILETEKGVNVYTSEGLSEIISEKILNVMGDEFNVATTEKLSSNIKEKIENKIKTIADFDKISSDNVELASSDKNNISIYISTSTSENSQTYGIVIKSPINDSILYTIEGIVKNERFNDQESLDIYAINKGLDYFSGKVRNGHLPKDVIAEIKTSNLSVSEMIISEPLTINNRNKIEKDGVSKILSSWVGSEHLDPYMNLAKDIAKTANRELGKENSNIIQSVTFENKDSIVGIVDSGNYSFNDKKKKSKKTP